MPGTSGRPAASTSARSRWSPLSVRAEIGQVSDPGDGHKTPAFAAAAQPEKHCGVGGLRDEPEPPARLGGAMLVIAWVARGPRGWGDVVRDVQEWHRIAAAIGADWVRADRYASRVDPEHACQRRGVAGAHLPADRVG